MKWMIGELLKICYSRINDFLSLLKVDEIYDSYFFKRLLKDI